MNHTQRFTVVFLVVLAAVIGAATLPQRVVKRFLVFYDGAEAGELAEAVGSAEARTDLAKRAILLTLRNPLFGVGPGMYADAEAVDAVREGRPRGRWQVAHNSYLAISAETGIPALIVYLAALASAYRMLAAVFKKLRRSGAHEPVMVAAFCVLLSMVMCGTSLFFLTLGLRYYFPTLTGLAVALTLAARRECASALAPVRLATPNLYGR